MSIFTWLNDHIGGWFDISPHSAPHPEINPATGLPMTGGVDVLGNPFGTNRDDLSPSQPHDSFDHAGSGSIGGGSSFDW